MLVSTKRYEILLGDGANSAGLSGSAIKSYARIIDSVAPDILLTANWGAIEWHIANRGKRAVPHIHFEDGFGPDETISSRKWTRDVMRRILFSRRATGNRPTAFVAPSRDLLALFEDAWRAPKQSVHLIENGVDMTAFPVATRTKNAAITIGAVGALRREKRFDRLLRQFAELKRKNTRLVMVGDGPERGELETLARALEIHERVVFAGTRSDIAEQLAKMDIFALSSDTEQMPISVIEAMATGLPVISTDVGDIKSMVAGDNQPYIAPLDDLPAYQNALIKLCDDAELREQLGKANAQTSRERYSKDKMLASYRALFQTMSVKGVAL